MKSPPSDSCANFAGFAGKAASEGEFQAWLAESRTWSEAQLERWGLPACGSDGAEAPWPQPLFEAAHYTLFGGGKRLRPILVRLFAEAAGGSAEGASRAAAALELVHTYSLVHDDLPCMDDDDLRRGRPTCHNVYGEALAVLVGDALLTRAFEVLAGAKGASAAGALQVLARAAGGAGMVGGQVLDMTVEASGASPEDVRDLQRKKTGALLGAACELGALTGGASPVACAGARDFGEALGLAFQVVDDALDITGDAVTLGKTPGKDQALGRATSVTVMGLEGARGEATRRAAAAREAALGLGFLESSLVLRLVEHLGSRSR